LTLGIALQLSGPAYTAIGARCAIGRPAGSISGPHVLLAAATRGGSPGNKMDKSLTRFDPPQGPSLPESDPLVNATDEGLLSENLNAPDVFELRRTPAPMLISRPSSVKRRPRRFPLAMAVSAGFAFFAAGLAFLAVGNPWAIRTIEANDNNGEPGAFSWLSLAPAKAELADSGGAKLLVNRPTPRRAGEVVPLGVSIHYSIDSNFFLNVSGLARGTTLSAGFPLSVDGWGLLAADIKDVKIQPPPNFTGVMNVTVELFITDTVRIDRQMLRFEWVGAEVPAAGITSEPINKAASDEIGPLLKRGKDLISSGDFAAARLVLRRAAEAGDARAAFALATTYDPATLEKFQAHGLSPDLAMARQWYEKARELGSQDASRSLELLARKP
jgi:hypothetical protein